MSPHPLLPDHTERSHPAAALVGWLIYGMMILGLLALLPTRMPQPTTTILAFGMIGAWRWSWVALHVARALIYKHLAFPKIRQQADRAAKPPALYVLVTSYRMTQALNAAVYSRLFDEIVRYGVPAFVVACVTDPADANNINERVARRALPEGSQVHIIAQRGLGKRDAMTEALTAIAAQHPPRGAQVVLMDGDTLLSEGSLGKACAVLAADLRLGAVTTNNIPLVRGSALAREWYRVRMAQRDILMASIALSGKLLVLTGRFSVFKAEIAISSRFINAIEQDFVDHGRLGRIRMHTGDDKSTWFETLRSGWKMLYLPDVVIHPVEQLPAGGFVKATAALMLRWHGNMIRNNGRALRLGPNRCGLFPWMCLLDQRISMWTSLVGPTLALVLALTGHGDLVIFYLLWVLLSRGVHCVTNRAVTGRFHPLFILITGYNQVVGSAIKIFVLFHPDRQLWTRQQDTARVAPHRSFAASLSTSYMAVALGFFILALITLADTLELGVRRNHPTGLIASLLAPVRPTPHVRSLGH